MCIEFVTKLHILTFALMFFSLTEQRTMEKDCFFNVTANLSLSLSRCSTLNCEVVVELLSHRLQDPSQTIQMVLLFCDLLL